MAVAQTRHPVVIVGAGPVGLTLAIDLAQRGQPVLLLDRAPDKHLTPGAGSRAICFAKIGRASCRERVLLMV